VLGRRLFTRKYIVRLQVQSRPLVEIYGMGQLRFIRYTILLAGIASLWPELQGLGWDNHFVGQLRGMFSMEARKRETDDISEKAYSRKHSYLDILSSLSAAWKFRLKIGNRSLMICGSVFTFPHVPTDQGSTCKSFHPLISFPHHALVGASGLRRT